MISHERFGELRLARFLPGVDLADLSDWQFMGRTWLREALGFSEWLRLESDPEVLRSLALDFSDFPESAAASVLKTLELPARPGMQLAELRTVLGDPIEKQHFVPDRVSYEFAVEGPPTYGVSCTPLRQGGLSYLVVMAPLGGLGA